MASSSRLEVAYSSAAESRNILEPEHSVIIESASLISEATAGNSSPGTDEANGSNARTNTHKLPSARRACNECRQQKLRCNVAEDPLSSCSRCARLEIECKIDANFKRVEKRRQARSRNELQNQQEQQRLSGSTNIASFQVTGRSEPWQGTNFTEGSLPEFGNAQGVSWPAMPIPDVGIASNTLQPHAPANAPHRRLDGIDLSSSVSDTLFQFHYHHFLPFLDPRKTPEEYYQASRLLYWSIIATASRRYSSDLTLLLSLSNSVPRLMWSTLQSVTQNYHDVKALCILCTWPFPKSSSSNDPTFLITGMLMSLAMQVGLHKSRHAQDFSKSGLNLRQQDFEDRYATWVACNIVTQSTSTGLGQPSTTNYDWMYDPATPNASNYLSPELLSRLKIEDFCSRATRALYGSRFNMQATLGGDDRSSIYQVLEQEICQLELNTMSTLTSAHVQLFFRCAKIHLRLYAFINTFSVLQLLSVYQECSSFMTQVVSQETDFLSYCPYYVFQIILASGFTLMRLLQSSFSQYVDSDAGKLLFNSAITACRKISISNNDLPGRLAEVLTQLWAWGTSEEQNGIRAVNMSPGGSFQLHEVQLYIKSRMSMSIVYDSLWRWRKSYDNEDTRPLALTTPDDDLASRNRSNGSDSGSLAISNNSALFGAEDATYNNLFPMDWAMDRVAGQPNDFIMSMDSTQWNP